MRKRVLSFFVCISLCICAVLFTSGCKKDINASVLFNVDGETYSTVKTNGKSIKEMPKDPEKTGYEFDGWFYDKDTFKNEFTQDSLAKDPIKKNIIIYAGFSAIEYTAIFKNGNDTVDTRTFNVEDSSISNLPTVPSKEGYNAAWENYTIKAGNMDIEAIYTPIEYTITYTNTKEATNSNLIVYNIETPTIFLTDLSKDGYAFEGWFIGDDEVTEIALGSTSNIELEAKWSLIEYEISYELNGGTNNPANPETYNIEDGTINLECPTKEGYFFAYWSINSSLCSSFSSEEKKNLTIEARWGDENFLKYNEEYDNIIITGFSSLCRKQFLRTLYIGNTINGKKVIGIYPSAFEDCISLESITLPFVGSSISATEASNDTLFGCIFASSSSKGTEQFYSSTEGSKFLIPSSLTSVTITGGNILYGSFYNCSNLTSLTLGKGVNSIGKRAFYGCSNIEKVNYLGTIEEWCRITFEESYSNPLSNVDKANLYFNNEIVTEIEIPSTITTIKDRAFLNCKTITNVKIGDNVESIGTSAFQGCINLSSVTIPASVESSMGSAFYNCNNLTKVNYLGTIDEWYQINFSTYSANPLNCGAALFIEDTKVENIVIPNSVTTIKQYAFYGCSSLKNVIIGNDVESIGKQAFYNCYNITNVLIGAHVTSLGSESFNKCYKLENVYIQNETVANVFDSDYIGGHLIENATTIYVKDSCTTVGSFIANNFTKAASLETIDGVTYNVYKKNA